jgi:hypothetical protein
MANGRGRDERREAFWRRTIREQERSGLLIRDFCRKSKLTESAFYFWRRELERRDLTRREAKQGQRRRPGQRARSPRPGAAPAFLPVEVMPDAPARSAGRIEIELSGARHVYVTPPVDRRALADVLAILEGRSC